MAQLVKLYDYISRYESNPHHYPSQYIRLKKEHRRKLQDRWLPEVNSSSKSVQESESEPRKSKWLPLNRNQQTAAQHTNVTNPPVPATEAPLKQHVLTQP